MSVYVETPADHDFTAFLAALTPGKVRRDLSANHSKSEIKRAAFLSQKQRLEKKKSVAELVAIHAEETRIALAMAREMRAQ